MYVTKTEIYEKVAPTGTLPYAPTEFLDNYHSYNSAGEITLPSERKVKIGATIPNVLAMNQFIENFRFGHYLVQGTFPGDNTSSRGKLVPEHVFKDRKHAAIRSMMVSFMEKRYDNFLFKDSYNLFEDDILMKMRVYAEGYKKFLDNDTSLYNLGSAKKHYISYEDVSPRIVTSKNEGQRESVLIKKYDTSLQYVNEELQKENVFTRLRESNLFPNNTDRAKHLAEQSKRLQAYVDYDKTTKVFNDIDIFERVYTQNIPSTLDYKKIVLYNLMENFYTYNNYTGDDKYLQNYESYIEGLEDTGYTLEVSDQTEKALYLKESLDETALLTKILQEDWKVL